MTLPKERVVIMSDRHIPPFSKTPPPPQTRTNRSSTTAAGCNHVLRSCTAHPAVMSKSAQIGLAGSGLMLQGPSCNCITDATRVRRIVRLNAKKIEKGYFADVDPNGGSVFHKLSWKQKDHSIAPRQPKGYCIHEGNMHTMYHTVVRIMPYMCRVEEAPMLQGMRTTDRTDPRSCRTRVCSHGRHRSGGLYQTRREIHL